MSTPCTVVLLIHFDEEVVLLGYSNIRINAIAQLNMQKRVCSFLTKIHFSCKFAGHKSSMRYNNIKRTYCNLRVFISKEISEHCFG